MRKLVKTRVGDEELVAIIDNGEVTSYRPITITHLNKDILGCVTYITLIGNAMTKTREKGKGG